MRGRPLGLGRGTGSVLIWILGLYLIFAVCFCFAKFLPITQLASPSARLEWNTGERPPFAKPQHPFTVESVGVIDRTNGEDKIFIPFENVPVSFSLDTGITLLYGSANLYWRGSRIDYARNVHDAPPAAFRKICSHIVAHYRLKLSFINEGFGGAIHGNSRQHTIVAYLIGNRIDGTIQINPYSRSFFIDSEFDLSLHQVGLSLHALDTSLSGLSRLASFSRLPSNSQERQDHGPSPDTFRPCDVLGPYWRLTGFLCIVAGLAIVAFSDRSRLVCPALSSQCCLEVSAYWDTPMTVARITTMASKGQYFFIIQKLYPKNT